MKIEAEGDKAACAVCGKVRRTIPFDTLADMVDLVVRQFVHRVDSSDPWYNPSYPNEIIQHEILGCDTGVADALVAYLSEAEAHDVIHDGATALYESDSQVYELIVPETTEFEDEWERFEEAVKHSGRFFLAEQREYLERIFRPMLRGELHSGEPPFVTLGASDSQIRAIYRGRPANTVKEQKQIFENPGRELAPPPPTLRTAGRMNAAGVTAFYGATDVTTCVAELAIPIGGAAVVGKFELLRPIRVLDLRLLGQATLHDISCFDPKYAEKIQYRRFVRRLRNRLRRPIMREAEALDYLPTQMVAEFFCNEGLGGVMFISSVMPEASAEERYETDFDESEGAKDEIARTTGVNVVLFSHSAVVEGDMGPPHRRVQKINPPVFFPDREDGWLYVEVAESPPPADTEPIPYPTVGDAVEPTLKLVNEGVVLAVPRSIEYKVKTASPTFSTPNEVEEF